MTAAQEIPAPEPVLRRDRLDYTPTSRSVSLCRHRATRLVTQWGHPQLAGDTALLVSELATNALLHGSLRGRLFRVELALTATALRIAVSDPRGERLPGLRAAEDDECYGRGLMIVAQLADDWGVEPRTVGKTVYAELSVRRPAPDMPVGPRADRAGPPETRTAGAVRPR
ncbi:ATP-binding protein [Streptomyces sp. NBC_01754]|uniref:ATP-binding protein n=1 Tax=Streptomyces sp. NBC_01754 TaxID=2975930 RepID=UPI002DD81B4C|nr:ATP-binding protein [Streptomyces sp. NBC_01754]WSC93539.1 ATP-binding protein [Streptomyces sp. NBC_01754]